VRTAQDDQGGGEKSRLWAGSDGDGGRKICQHYTDRTE